MMKYIFTTACLILVGIGAYWIFFQEKSEEEVMVANFKACIQLEGSLIMESYPRRCQTAGGETFTEDIGNLLEKNNMIRIDRPRPNATITSPLTVKGEARGFWYSEGLFHVVLLDEDMRVVAEGNATAQENGMTEAFVPFEATLQFAVSTSTLTSPGEEGVLVFMRANPSGLLENNQSLRIPFIFGESQPLEDNENATSTEL